MNNEERKPTGLLHSSDALKQFIVENSDLPILAFGCSHVIVEKGEFLDCEQQIDDCKCYTDRDDFEDDVADFLAGEEQYRDLPDNEFNALV